MDSRYDNPEPGPYRLRFAGKLVQYSQPFLALFAELLLGHVELVLWRLRVVALSGRGDGVELRMNPVSPVVAENLIRSPTLRFKGRGSAERRAPEAGLVLLQRQRDLLLRVTSLSSHLSSS